MATLDRRKFLGHELLDREPVLREIAALVREAHARGAPAMVRVCGPPGVGKTALLRAAAAALGGRMREIAAGKGGRTDSGSVARMLAGDDGATVSSGNFSEQLRTAVGAIDVMIVDDLQWIDEGPAAALRDALTTSHITVLLGDRRPYAPEWPPHATVNLAPLRGASAMELARREYSGISDAVAARIAEASDGLPLSVIVIAADAAARGVQAPEDTAPSLASVVAARLARVPRRAREFAEMLSLADSPAPLTILASALGVAVDDAAAAAAEISELVAVADGSAAFRYETLATVVAGMVANAVAFHERLLDVYEPLLGHQAAAVRCAVACGQTERAAAAALRLARSLARDGALGSALRQAEIALRNAPQPPPPEYVAEHAVLLQMLARDAEAAGLLRQAVRAAIDTGDAAAASDLVAALFNPMVTLERFAELEGVCARVESMAGCKSAVAARLRTVRLASLAYEGRFDEYERLAATTDRMTWEDARTDAFVRAMRGEFTRASTDMDAYTSGLQTRHARQEAPDTMLDRVLTFFYRGTRALDPLESLPAEAARHPSEHALRVLARICDGRWQDARTLLDARRDEPREPEQILEVRLLLAALSRGEFDSGRALAQVRAMVEQRRIRHAASAARWFAVAAGPACPADVSGFVRETLDVAPMPYALAASPVSIAMLAGTLEGDRCAAAINRHPVFQTPWHRAHAALAAGLVGDAAEPLRSARATFEELNCPAFAAFAGVALPAPRARDVAVARKLGLVPSVPPPATPLTPRQRAIAEYVSTGASNQEIAIALSISVRTVETHLTKIYAKLNVSSRGTLSALIHRDAQ